MVKNAHLVEQFEAEFQREHPLTLEEKFVLCEGVYRRAKAGGDFVEKDFLERLKGKVRLAHILNIDVPYPSL